MLGSPLREIQANHNVSVGEAKVVADQILHEELSYGYRLFNNLLQKHKNQVKVLLDDEMDGDENINKHSFSQSKSSMLVQLLIKIHETFISVNIGPTF